MKVTSLLALMAATALFGRRCIVLAKEYHQGISTTTSIQVGADMTACPVFSTAVHGANKFYLSYRCFAHIDASSGCQE